jgi:hypothetical protein
MSKLTESKKTKPWFGGKPVGLIISWPSGKSPDTQKDQVTSQPKTNPPKNPVEGKTP